jgi:sugar lactone lactonase YvrE
LKEFDAMRIAPMNSRHSALLTVLVALVFPGSPTTAQDMPLSQILIDGEDWKLIASGFEYAEGPAVNARGMLYFSDVPKSTILKHDTIRGVANLFENTERTNGLMFGPGGRLYGCCNGLSQIVAWNVREPKADPTVLAQDVSSNDLVVTRTGDIYFTDPKNHQVWLVKADGEKRIVDTGIGFPNGIIMWPDQKTLVVADSSSPHVWTFRIEADGSLAYKQPYYTLRIVTGKEGSGADGMTIDTKGRLYVATHAGLQIFDPTGRMSGVLLLPQAKRLSNVTFGGGDMSTLYVTSTDKVYRRKTKATGVRFAK